MKKYNLIEGRTSAELILVMVLLILFSISTLTLVATSSESYSDIINKNNDNSNLRIAQSYLYTKIRQNLEKDAVSIENYEEIEGDCLVIKDNYSNVEYDTVIFVQDGQMKESLVLRGNDFNPDSSVSVIEIDQVNFEIIDNKGLMFETISSEKNEKKSLKGFISLLNN